MAGIDAFRMKECIERLKMYGEDDTCERLKLIWNWIKVEFICFKEFEFLINWLNDRRNQKWDKDL